MGQKTVTIPLRGGLDVSSPAIAVDPGRCIACQNYEPEVRGYSRTVGYERYDGQPKPSEATYRTIDYITGTVAIVAGETVTGATSGASGIMVVDQVISSGTVAGGDAAGYLALYNVSGTFQNGENLQVGGVTRAVAASADSAAGAPTDALDASYRQAAVEARRTAIGAVPGSGQVRGVFIYDGAVYAIRDNAGGTAADMYKASTSGWVLQSFGRVLAFTSGGTTVIEEGDLIRGITSGAEATVERVILQSGSWGGGDAAGWLVLSGQTGTFVAENIDDVTAAAVNDATIAGNSTAITLPAGGTYEVRIENFYGSSALKRAYMVNGVGRAMEWDGAVLAPIYTGLSDALDKPTHVAVRSNHLLLAFRGGAIMGSGTGEPLDFRVVSGAFEFALGEDITGMLDAAATSTVIFGRNKISYLTGTDSANFVLNPLSEEAGAREWTVQKITIPMYVDDQGIRRLDASDAFGDFRMGAVSADIEPLFRSLRGAGALPIASCRVRARDQYRVFLDNYQVLCVYMGGKRPEIMVLKYTHLMRVTFNGEDADGNEIILAGSDDGWVFQLMSGLNFDGEEVAAFIRFPFNNIGSPTQRKRWNKATIEFDGASDTLLGIVADFAYADPDIPSAPETLAEVAGSGGIWDVARWDEFYWSQPVQGRIEAYLDGIGQNVSVTLVSDATWEDPHTLSALTLNFTYRGMIR